MSEQSIPRPELLLPAGDLEKLETAARFGADAVYIGASGLSLRAATGSFTLGELEEGIRFAHERACRVYLALNIFAFDGDLEAIRHFFKMAVKYGIDAVIISDPGVLAMVKEMSTGVKIHLSTQANTTNSAAVKFWLNQGVNRIVLARELSLEQIQQIKQNIPQAELEIFIHGAMCVSYSGRCLLSKHLTDRSANKGECAQPCRWEYFMREALNGDELTAEEDLRGTYILNSRDLCLIEHIPELVQSGVSSFKIEGRMKSAYYVAVVARIYRQALEAYCGDPANYQLLPQWKDELQKVSHRFYTTGFYLGNEPLEYIKDSAYIRGYDFVGMVESYDPANGQLIIAARNHFSVNDELELLDPHALEVRGFKLKQLKKNNGEIITEANNDYVVVAKIEPLLEKISRHSVLRKKR